MYYIKSNNRHKTTNLKMIVKKIKSFFNKPSKTKIEYITSLYL